MDDHVHALIRAASANPEDPELAERLERALRVDAEDALLLER